jgi:hypothetical protein
LRKKENLSQGVFFFMCTKKLADILFKNRPNEPKLYPAAIAAGTFFVMGWQAVNHSLAL